MTRREKMDMAAGLLFVSPWLIGLSVFILGPIVMAAYYSLCDYSVLNDPVFIGAGNYSDLIHDEVFWKSLKNTLFFAALALPMGTLLSLGLALLLNAKIHGRVVFRAIFFLPSLVPLVALAILWNWIFNGQHGILNHALGWFGIQGPDWLGDIHLAKPAILLTGLWGVGNAVVIYLAGLQEIPSHLYEAAKIDGANRWQQTIHITLPMLSPVIYFNLIMGCITVLQVFAVPFVMTGPNGPPARSTLFYTMYLFNMAFTYLNMGYACAMAWVLGILIAVLTALAHKLTYRHVHYGA